MEDENREQIKKQILLNISNKLALLNQKIEIYEDTFVKIDQKQEFKEVEESDDRPIERSEDGIKIKTKENDKKSSTLEKLVKGLFFILFSTLPILIRKFNESKDLIKKIPSRLSETFHNLIDKTYILFNDNVYQPLKELINIKIPAIVDTITTVLMNGIQSILYAPLSIANYLQIQVEHIKFNFVSKALNIIVDYNISRFIPLKKLESSLQKQQILHIKKIKELEDEQQLRQDELEKSKRTDYGTILSQNVAKRQEETQKEETQKLEKKKPKGEEEKDTKYFLENTDSSELLSVAGIYDASIDKVNPEMKKRTAAMAKAFTEKTGQKLTITSGYRDNQKQKELWDAALAKNNGDVAKTRWQVAEPMPPLGRGKGSTHFFGLAIDIKDAPGSSKLNILAGSQSSPTGWLEQFGLIRPVPNEDWHIQLAGSPPAADNPVSPGSPIALSTPSGNITGLKDGKSTSKSSVIGSGDSLKKASMEAKIDKPEPEDIIVVQQQTTRSKPSVKSGGQAFTPSASDTKKLYKQVLAVS